MYTDAQRQQFSNILAHVADSLDIPESKYREAVSRYEAISKWLDSNDSNLHIYKPTIYPQGSFMLGTMVRPMNDGDEYDVDLVCHLEIDKDNITKSELKKMVGDRLKENGIYAKILKEGKRCWTLDYANEFHMDILPAIPDYERLQDSILITDRRLLEWQKSNPKGYARWFVERMRVIFEQRRVLLAESSRVNVEEIPEWKVRTPLQRSIQILKRHRDICFSGKDHKPISIIITTLAAHAYSNEADLFEALSHIIDGMTDPRNIKNKHGQYYIPNPTNPDENFAEKWNENPNLPKAFSDWLSKLKVTLEAAIHQKDLLAIKESLGPMFGTGIVGTAFNQLEPATVAAKSYPRVTFSSNPNKQWAY